MKKIESHHNIEISSCPSPQHKMPAKEFVFDLKKLEEYDVTKDDLYEVDMKDDKLRDMLKKLTRYVKDNFTDIREGDLVVGANKAERYRNDGVYIWDGKKVCELDFMLDEYGAIPSKFVVTDTKFSPDWWVDLIAHNNYFWLSQEIRDRASKTLKMEEDEITGTVTIGDKVWTICLDEEELDFDAFARLLTDVRYPLSVDDDYIYVCPPYGYNEDADDEDDGE